MSQRCKIPGCNEVMYDTGWIGLMRCPVHQMDCMPEKISEGGRLQIERMLIKPLLEKARQSLYCSHCGSKLQKDEAVECSKCKKESYDGSIE